MSSAYGPIIRTPTSAKVVCATNNIPTSFSAAAGSKVLTNLSPNRYKHMMVINETGEEISVCSTNDGIPASNTNTRIFVPAGSFCFFDGFPVGDSCYLQSEAVSPISDGTVEVQFW